MDEFVFDAFISYSHRDLSWGRWLQRKLETYRVPKGVLEPGAGARRLRVFRDQTDLAGVELQASLRRELRASRHLIVLCSPESAASKWVAEEIRFFRSLGREDRIVPFIVRGEPESDDPALECFGEELLGEGRHPLGVSARELGREKAFLRLVSILLGVRFDRIVDRHKRRRRRRLAVTAAAASAAAGLAALLLLRDARISRENRRMSFDMYGAAIVSLVQEETSAEDVIRFLTVSAEAGNVKAMMLLADCLQNGKGADPDPEAAFYWYGKAAEQGDPTALLAVSNCYRSGTGTREDPEQAFLWNTRAAEAGEPAGMLNVALCLESGYGTDADAALAFGWYKKAAEAGNDLGVYHLARCYLTGAGTDRDEAQAFFWTRRLAESGNTQGMYNLAMMYQEGFGTEEDPEQAYAWYRKAAEAGDPDGMYRTGWCLENRYGVESAVLEWYQRAAEAGSAEAAEALLRLRGGAPAGDGLREDGPR